MMFWLSCCFQMCIKLIFTFELFFHRKTEPQDNEVVNAQSYPHPTKLPFNISDEIQKDIKIAAENIDK